MGGIGEGGVLGARFEPHEYPYLRVSVAATTEAGGRRAPGRFLHARVGLPLEYVGGVLAGALQEPGLVGPGTLTFWPRPSPRAPGRQEPTKQKPRVRRTSNGANPSPWPRAYQSQRSPDGLVTDPSLRRRTSTGTWYLRPAAVPVTPSIELSADAHVPPMCPAELHVTL